jgi:hypothetical protein
MGSFCGLGDAAFEVLQENLQVDDLPVPPPLPLRVGLSQNASSQTAWAQNASSHAWPGHKQAACGKSGRKLAARRF